MLFYNILNKMEYMKFNITFNFLLFLVTIRKLQLHLCLLLHCIFSSRHTITNIFTKQLQYRSI